MIRDLADGAEPLLQCHGFLRSSVNVAAGRFVAARFEARVAKAAWVKRLHLGINPTRGATNGFSDDTRRCMVAGHAVSIPLFLRHDWQLGSRLERGRASASTLLRWAACRTGRGPGVRL